MAAVTEVAVPVGIATEGDSFGSIIAIVQNIFLIMCFHQLCGKML
jgi:hypothetical protein